MLKGTAALARKLAFNLMVHWYLINLPVMNIHNFVSKETALKVCELELLPRIFTLHLINQQYQMKEGRKKKKTYSPHHSAK